jgi:multiple sugar transport system substrate-binding protein
MDRTNRMLISRRKLLTGCAAAGSALLLSSAARAATPPQPAATTAPGTAKVKVTVKYLTWWWAETGRNLVWRQFVKDFEAANPDIHIEEVSVPYARYEDTVITQLAGGQLEGDILSMNDAFFLRLARAGHLLPVDDIPARAGVADRLEPENQMAVINGKRVGLVIVMVPNAIIYNQKLYDEAGIKEPPKTPDEYFEVAQRLTKQPDLYGHAMRSTMPEVAGWWQDLIHWVAGYDGKWAVQGRPTATDPGVIKAVKMQKKLYDAKVMPQGADAGTYRKMAWQGKIGQYLDNHANITVLRTGNPDIYPLLRTAAPPWPNKKSLTVVNFLGVYSQTKVPNEAKRVLEFLYKPQNYQKLMESALDIRGLYKGCVSDDFIKKNAWTKGFLESVSFPQPPEGFETKLPEFRRLTLQRVSEVLTNNRPAEEAMADAQKDLEELAKR